MNDTFWQRLFRGVRRLRQRPDWLHFMRPDWVDGIMTVAVTDRFHAKQGRSTGRWILYRADRRLAVYLKRHYRLSWWRGWLATVWPQGDWSPALREWRHLEWARAQGLSVPAAVAAGELIGPWGRLRSFLAVEELSDMVPLHEAVPAAAAYLDPQAFQQWKRGLIAEMARLTRQLHQQRHFHKDLYLCHFYTLQKHARQIPVWYGQVYLIDLHRLSHHPWSWPVWQIKDLAQLVYSSEVSGVEARDRLRFWRAYLSVSPRRMWARWLRWCLLAKWQRYRKHNRGHARPWLAAKRI